MPDRAVVPLICGVSFGFIAGLIASVTQMQQAGVIELALLIALAAGFAGAASVVGVRGSTADRTTVAVLRGSLAAMLGALVIFGMTQFLRDGQIVTGLLLFGLAGLVALPLVRLRVRTPPEERKRGRGGNRAASAT
jgi:hypothetical protein